MGMKTIEFDGLTDHIFFNLGITITHTQFGKETALYALDDRVRKVPKKNNMYLTKGNEVVVISLGRPVVIGKRIENDDWEKLLIEKTNTWRSKILNRPELTYDFPQYNVFGKRLSYTSLFRTFKDAPERACKMHLEDLCNSILPYGVFIHQVKDSLLIFFKHPKEIGEMHAKLLAEVPIQQYLSSNNSKRICFVKSLLIVTYDSVEKDQKEIEESTWYL